MSTGAILIRLRKQLRLSQSEVAEQVGVCQTTYQSWECDRTSVKGMFLVKLAQILHVPVTDLLTARHLQPDTAVARQPVPGTYPPDYRDELIASQRREIELLQVRIVELNNRLMGGVNPGAVG